MQSSLSRHVVELDIMAQVVQKKVEQHVAFNFLKNLNF